MADSRITPKAGQVWHAHGHMVYLFEVDGELRNWIVDAEQLGSIKGDALKGWLAIPSDGVKYIGEIPEEIKA